MPPQGNKIPTLFRRQLTGLTWAVVVVWRQLISMMAVAIVAVVRIDAHLRAFSVVEIAFVHWAA